MKRRIALFTMIAALLLSGLCAARAETLGNSIRLGGTGDDSLSRNNWLITPEGNLLLVMQTTGGHNEQPTYPHNARKTWLVCLAPDGSTLWEREIGEKTGASILYNLRLRADGSFDAQLNYSIDQVTQYTRWQRYSLTDGALLWEGEKEQPYTVEGAMEYCYIAGTRTLRTCFNGSQATSESRMYQLEEADGKVLWQAGARAIGLSGLNGVAAVEGGTVLYGFNGLEGENGYVPVLLKMDDAGAVQWRVALDEVKNGKLDSYTFTKDGLLVLAGWSHEDLASDTGVLRNVKQVLCCVNPVSGDVRWKKLNALADGEALVRGAIVEVDQGFVLSGGNGQFSGIAYQLIDHEGNELARWETSLPETTFIGSDLFLWNGVPWMASFITQEEDNSDVLLQRVELPALDAAGDQWETIRAMTVEWERRLGPNAYWTLEDKAAFCQQFGAPPSLIGLSDSYLELPAPTDVTQAKAVEEAHHAIISQYQWTAEQVNALKLDIGFYTNGSFSAMSGAERTWVIRFCDESADAQGVDETPFTCYVPSPRGMVTLVRNLTAPLLMRWGFSEQSAAQLCVTAFLCYRNPDGGKYFHRDSVCEGIPEKYRNQLEAFQPGLLPLEPYHSLKPCPICMP
ncbi:MAG: hypothetical protein RR065_03505 [Clostridia bacterium]